MGSGKAHSAAALRHPPHGPVAQCRTVAGEGWLPWFGCCHQAAVVVLLMTLLGASAIAAPLPVGGVALLFGGALIGIPHGSSDFVVAYRVLQPGLGRGWLPAFLAAYLAAVGAMALSWAAVPATTFLAFLAISGLHFGAPDGDAAVHDNAFRYLARALTPVLPIFLCHPGEVAGIVGLMTGWPADAVAGVLVALRPAVLPAYATLLGWVVIGATTSCDDQTSARLREAGEVVLLAMAAAILSPLVTFAVYFCLIHAVRHMAQLGHAVFPRRAGAALGLSVAIVLPSALACCLALSFAWNALAGVLSTETLLAKALQLTAALTVPHVALEWRATRHTA